MSAVLLPDFVELAGGLQQVELGLLALEVGVEILHPLFVFGDAGALDFAEIHFAFIELRLEDGDVLLG